MKKLKLILLFTLLPMFLFAQGGESYGKKTLWDLLTSSSITTSSGYHVLPYANNLYNFGASGTIWNLIYGDTLISNGVLSPYIIGGTATTSDLYFKTTTGVGTTGADMHFLVGSNGGTEAMTILNSGYVGINTTPTSLFHVKGTTGKIAIESSGTDVALLQISNGGGLMWFGREKSIGGGLVDGSIPYAGVLALNGTYPFQLAINNAVAMTILNGGNTGFGTTTPLHKQTTVSAIATNLNAFNFVDSDINLTRTTVAQATDTSSFSLKYSSLGSPTLSLKGKTGNSMIYVDSVGVGIGTISPGRLLGLYGDGAGIEVLDNNGPKGWFLADDTEVVLLAQSNHSLSFGTNAAKNKMVLTTAGELLINTTTDAGTYQLQTNGQAIFLAGTGGSATDSSFQITYSSGSPVANFFGTDGDTWNIGINTDDGALFSGATTYNFDTVIKTTGGIVIGTNGGEIDSAKVVDGNLDAFVGGTAYTALNTAYGDAYIVGTSPQTINVTVDSTYFTVKTLTSGAVLKNVTVQDSSLTVGVAGVYSIEYNISFSTTNFSAGNTVRGYIFVDDVQSDKTGFRRFVSGTNDTGSASGSGILSLTANQVVKLKIEGLDDGDDGEIIVHNANISVKRID